jgi:hypothetical protein
MSFIRMFVVQLPNLTPTKHIRGKLYVSPMLNISLKMIKMIRNILELRHTVSNNIIFT